MKTKAILAVVAMAFLFSLAAIAYAAPNTPQSLTEGTPERRTIDETAKTASAWAGNITQITIDDTRITDRWQGYYGNVSGSITLDDANNMTLIDWSLGTIEGEIYASNGTINAWTTIHCVNFTSNGTNCPWSNPSVSDTSPTCVNLSKLESFLGAGTSDNDGVDETFNETGGITVGTIALTSCPLVDLYVNDSSTPQFQWNETMLTLNNTDDVIYAAIVNDDYWGFNNQTWDFQMIVGDNGDDSLATTYNFYVELS